MLQPLAIVFYERVMPGSQLVNRLQDMHYRVLALANAARLAATVLREMPLLVIADLDAQSGVADAITKIRAEAATNHISIIAFAPDHRPELLPAAQAAGANLAVTESALTGHFAQMLDQALHVE